MMTKSKLATYRFVACIAALAAAVLLACTVAVPNALANRQLDAPTKVSDDITRLEVSKFDADTHEYLEGAQMQILEVDKDGNETLVVEWVTGDGPRNIDKMLNVDTEYILREFAAPDGYEKVKDTHFKINSEEGSGIKILSDKNDQVELTESFKFSLYHKAKALEDETTVTETRAVTEDKEDKTSDKTSSSNNRSTGSSTSTTVAPKTGDETPLTLVGLLMALGVVAIVVLEIPKRRIKE